jgi:hypothetical protein
MVVCLSGDCWGWYGREIASPMVSTVMPGVAARTVSITVAAVTVAGPTTLTIRRTARWGVSKTVAAVAGRGA